MATKLPTFSSAITRYQSSFVEVDTETLDRSICNMAHIFGAVRDWRDSFQIEFKYVDDECRRLLIERGRLRPGDGKDIAYTQQADVLPRIRQLVQDSDWDIIHESAEAVTLRRKARRSQEAQPAATAGK